jgi:hypothetical protein
MKSNSYLLTSENASLSKKGIMNFIGTVREAYLYSLVLFLLSMFALAVVKVMLFLENNEVFTFLLLNTEWVIVGGWFLLCIVCAWMVAVIRAKYHTRWRLFLRSFVVGVLVELVAVGLFAFFAYGIRVLVSMNDVLGLITSLLASYGGAATIPYLFVLFFIGHPFLYAGISMLLHKFMPHKMSAMTA